jgi:hypothetical protein
LLHCPNQKHSTNHERKNCLPMCWGVLQPIQAALDRNHLLVLSCRLDEHVRELLQSALDLCHTKVHVLQFGAHSIVSTRCRYEVAAAGASVVTARARIADC